LHAGATGKCTRAQAARALGSKQGWRAASGLAVRSAFLRMTSRVLMAACCGMVLSQSKCKLLAKPDPNAVVREIDKEAGCRDFRPTFA